MSKEEILHAIKVNRKIVKSLEYLLQECAKSNPTDASKMTPLIRKQVNIHSSSEMLQAITQMSHERRQLILLTQKLEELLQETKNQESN